MIERRKNAGGCNWLPWVLCLFFLAVTLPYWLLLGLDFTDETFPVVVARQLDYGGKLFVDEIDIHQTTTAWVLPFYKIFTSLRGDLDGVMVFIRFCFLAVFCSAAAVFVWSRRAEMPAGARLAAVLPLLMVAPVAMSGLMFNTGALLAIAAFFWAGGLKDIHSRSNAGLWVLGFWCGVLSVFFPTLIFPSLLTFFWLRWRERTEWRRLWWLLLGGVGGLAPLIILVLQSDPVQVLHALRMNVELFYPFFSGRKVLRLFEKSLPVWWVLLFIPLGLVVNLQWWRQHREKIIFIVLAVMTVFFLSYGVVPMQGDRITSAYFYFLTAVGLSDRELRNRVGSSNWFFSLAVVAMAAYTSDFLAVLSSGWVLGPVSLLVLYELAKTHWLNDASADLPGPGHSSERWRYRTVVASMALLALGIAGARLKYHYDSPLSYDLKQVPSGPYRYLLAAPEKIEFLQLMTETAEKIPKDARLLTYFNFPAMYLLSPARPWTNYHWSFIGLSNSRLMSEMMYSYYEERGLFPEYMVEMKSFLGKRREWVDLIPPPDEPFHRKMHEHPYELIEENRALKLYRAAQGL